LYGYVHNPNGWIDPFGLLAEVLHRMRVQIQKGSTNIVSQSITSQQPITARQLERAMMDMIDGLPSAGRPDLVPRAHGAAADISKQVRESMVGNGGISQGGNVLRRDLGGGVRFDVENNSGTNLNTC